MKKSLRQSMDWLHTWTGLLMGWLLYFVFLTGNFGYLNAEITRWMQPELPMATRLPASELVERAETRLRAEAASAESWTISLPGGRLTGDTKFGPDELFASTGLSVSWVEASNGGKPHLDRHEETLDPASGLPRSPVTPRETGGGMLLYQMHYTLHYLQANDIGQLIVGVATMFMLVAMLSGIITHKKFFSSFFTFRPGKGQLSWVEGHNLLSVTALPFLIMITWTGFVFTPYLYMPVVRNALYPQGPERDRFELEAQGPASDRAELVFRGRSASSDPDRQSGGASSGRAIESRPAPLVPLTPLVAQVEKDWGHNQITRIEITNPLRSNARVTFTSPYGFRSIQGGFHYLRFDGSTGRALPADRDLRTAPEEFRKALTGLHQGRSAGTLLRLLYLFSGFAGTAMVATGQILWSTKRSKGQFSGRAPHFGVALVDSLNVGTIIGLPIAIAVYFWANRLIPADIVGRGAWEAHAMFITWGLTFAYAAWRPQARAWIDLCWLAAAAWGLLPLLNLLTTDRHLGVTIAAGDWALASLDLGMGAAGVFFLWLGWTMMRKPARAAPRGARWRAAPQTAVAAE